MRIQYISDIHLEFLKKFNISKIFSPQKDVDVLCLCGDIGYPFSKEYEMMLIHSSKHWKKTFLIAGNHEYYNENKKFIGDKFLVKHSMEENQNKIKSIIKDNNLENITFLDNSYEDYQGYRFIGSTLWSKLPENPEKKINDFYCIKDMTVEKYNQLHKDSLYFLELEMSKSEENPIVMLTHHMPSYTLIDEKYKTPRMEPYNMYFASELDYLIKPPIKLWLYGHTHSESDTIINGVRLCCNPGGYPLENVGKDFNKVIELI
jgi:predicted phosphodiesterase